MAEITLGEAIGNQGVYRPESTFNTILKGLQTGMAMGQKKDAQDQKINELISKNVQVDPDKYIPSLYGKAKEETNKFLQTTYQLKKQYGDGRFMYTTEFQKAKSDFDYNLKNWQEESAAVKALKTAREKGAVVDNDFLNAAYSGDYNQFASYKNDLTGEMVDPATGRSNVQAVNAYDIQTNLPKYFPITDKGLYNIQGEKRKYGGGSNDFVVQWKLNPEVVKERASIFVKDHPEAVRAVLITRKQEVKDLMGQMAKEVQAQGTEPDPETLKLAAATKLVEQDISKRLQKFVEEKVSVPEYKPSSGGVGATTNVSEITDGSMTVATPAYNPTTGAKVDNPITYDIPTVQFSAKPVKAGVSVSKNVYDAQTGERVTDVGVQQAEFGDYKVVPVYKKGAKGKSGADLSGRIVLPVDIEKNKNSIEYVPMAYGSYTQGGDTYSVYRPMKDVEGSAISTATGADAEALQNNFAKLRQIASKKNAELNGATTQEKIDIKIGNKSYKVSKQTKGYQLSKDGKKAKVTYTDGSTEIITL